MSTDLDDDGGSASAQPVQWDDAQARSTRAGICQVKSSREETALLFGTPLAPADATGGLRARLDSRVLLSPRKAKLLARALHAAVRAREAHSAPAPQAGRAAEPDPSPRTRPLYELVRRFYPDCGQERSFKLSTGRLASDRLILAVKSAQADSGALLEILAGMRMPQALLGRFRESLPEANTIGFGIEADEESTVYKVYLEFWDRLVARLRSDPRDVSPELLFVGFKWDAEDPSRAGVARYTCHPLLTVPAILRRLEALYEGRPASASLQAARGMIQQAAARIGTDSFVYVEAAEEGSPRASFDINVYKADLPLEALAPMLAPLCDRYAIPRNLLARELQGASQRAFGHLSGGIGRNGEDFLTVYYEIEPIWVRG